jgi:hypothetical protein
LVECFRIYWAWRKALRAYEHLEKYGFRTGPPGMLSRQLE